MVVGGSWQGRWLPHYPVCFLQASDATYSCALHRTWHKLKHGQYPRGHPHLAFFLRTHLIKPLGAPESPCFLIIEGHCKVSVRIKCHESMNGLYTNEGDSGEYSHRPPKSKGLEMESVGEVFATQV